MERGDGPAWPSGNALTGHQRDPWVVSQPGQS